MDALYQPGIEWFERWSQRELSSLRPAARKPVAPAQSIAPVASARSLIRALASIWGVSPDAARRHLRRSPRFALDRAASASRGVLLTSDLVALAALVEMEPKR